MEAATFLAMEDLMHDFARYLLGDRLIVVDGRNGATSRVNNKSSSSAYLALVSNFDASRQLDISSILPAGILALRFEGCGEMELSDGAFASFAKRLRLLDLSGYSENKMLPDFIRRLKQLRYLKAPEIQDEELPGSITGLYELRYLILHRSPQLSDLTEAFERLRNLLHLDLSGCTGLKKLPDSFKSLWRLEHLDLSACSGIEALPESFGRLRNLKHLDLSRCSELKELPESFGELTGLWHLDLSRCSQLVQDLYFNSLKELRHLDLSGCSGLPELSMGWLPGELRHLNLSGCSGLQQEELPHPLAQSVRHLDLSGCPSVPTLSDLKGLVHLNLSGCSGLSQLPKNDSWRLKLKHLDLSNCSQLEDATTISDLKMLQHLDLSGCSRIKLPDLEEISDVVASITRRGGRASGPQDASLRGLGTNGTTN